MAPPFARVDDGVGVCSCSNLIGRQGPCNHCQAQRATMEALAPYVSRAKFLFMREIENNHFFGLTPDQRTELNNLAVEHNRPLMRFHEEQLALSNNYEGEWNLLSNSDKISWLREGQQLANVHPEVHHINVVNRRFVAVDAAGKIFGFVSIINRRFGTPQLAGEEGAAGADGAGGN